MTFRGILYALAKFLGDVSAIKNNRAGRRIGRRAAGKVTGRLMRGVFK